MVDFKFKIKKLKVQLKFNLFISSLFQQIKTWISQFQTQQTP